MLRPSPSRSRHITHYPITHALSRALILVAASNAIPSRSPLPLPPVTMLHFMQRLFVKDLIEQTK